MEGEIAERGEAKQGEAERQHAPALRPDADETVEDADHEREDGAELIVVERLHDREEHEEEDAEGSERSEITPAELPALRHGARLAPGEDHAADDPAGDERRPDPRELRR